MADKFVVQVGLAPTAIRVPSGSLENQTIISPAGSPTVYLGQAGVTPATGMPFPAGSEYKALKNAASLFGCVAGSTVWAGAPAFPGSGSAATNTSGQAMTVTIAGGTVSAIAIGATTQSVNGVNLTSGTFVVPAGSTITVTDSVSPTTYLWQSGQQASLLVTTGVQQT